MDVENGCFVVQGNDIDVNEPPSLVYKDENVSASSSDKEVKSEEVKSEERRYSGGIVTLSEKIGLCHWMSLS